MKRASLLEQPRLLAVLALAFSLLPAGLAVLTYRDALRKDERVFETTAGVLAEHLQSQFERHTYLPVELKRAALRLDDEAVRRGAMMPAFDWQARLPHLLAMAYAERAEGRMVVRWMSEQRAPVAKIGDDLLRIEGVAGLLDSTPGVDLHAARGLLLPASRMLVMMAVTSTDGKTVRGFIMAWIDLDSMCRDAEEPLLREQMLAVTPLEESASAPAGMRSVVIRDGNARWLAMIRRGAKFSERYSLPTPWLLLGAVGLSALPLLLLASLAARSTRLRAELAAEQEITRQQRFFTQSVSHEFRTPLGIIMSGADLLDDYLDHLTPERRREVLMEIKDNTRQMSGMVEQVLMLGRIESRQQSCSRRPVNVATLCHDIAHKVCTSMNREHAVRVIAPDREVMLDAALLGSILDNLLSNAIKYSPPEKQVKLEATLQANEIVFTVRDEGIGIPSDEIARVCDPFHRCANVGDAPGAGLGLAITQRCVALHGGTLRVESIEGQGTTMTVNLPIP
ncbi:MAG: ATP-binding protein [Verrucomicrobiaceae bacterium]